MSSDLIGIWEVTLRDGVHQIDFEHGTVTGKRVIRVDGKEILRRDWMFKLVGREYFQIGRAKCSVNIEACNGFAYEYTLEVNGKSLQKFIENQSKIMKTWLVTLDVVPTRVVLEKDTLDIWVNGQKMETAGEFVDGGTETHFEIGTHTACLKNISSGNKRAGIIHTLYVDNIEIPESSE